MLIKDLAQIDVGQFVGQRGSSLCRGEPQVDDNRLTAPVGHSENPVWQLGCAHRPPHNTPHTSSSCSMATV